jgi:hypothetical protein
LSAWPLTISKASIGCGLFRWMGKDTIQEELDNGHAVFGALTAHDLRGNKIAEAVEPFDIRLDIVGHAHAVAHVLW